MQTTPSPTAYKQTNIMSNVLFGSRWLQLPLYLGLVVAQAVYVYFFGWSFTTSCTKSRTWSNLKSY